MEAARWPAIPGLLSTQSAKHSEAQTDDERDRAAAHFGDGEKGTEHHVGEATGSNARVQTEAAREVREEEDSWQDAGGHEEEAKACRATRYTYLRYAQGWYAYGALTPWSSHGKAHVSTRADANRPCAEVEGLLEGEHHDEDVRVERPTVN
eukprot:scaffold21845_cov73-Phaeocystis_antarctica.AAC.1